MATKDEIKLAILKVAGDPVSGILFDLADEMAEAVYKLDNAAATERAEKETRVTKPAEIR